MSDLAVVSPSLPELATIANREHVLVEESISAVFEHALRAGDALNAAFAQLPEGEWQSWVATNFAGRKKRAEEYRRLATFRELLEEHGISGITSGLRFLTAEGLILGRRWNELPEEQVNVIRELKKAGVGHHAIARTVGVCPATVRRYAVKGYLAQQRKKNALREREQRAAAVALRREIETKAAKRLGGDVERVFTLIVRDLAPALDQTASQFTGEARKAWEAAYHAVRRAEDEVRHALRAAALDD